MNMQKSLMVLAGAAMGLSSVTLAQSSDGMASSELKTDAATRSSFQGDSGFPTLKLSGYTQFQFGVNWRDDGPLNTPIVGDDTLTTGFRFASTKLVAKGNVTEEWSYKLQANFAPDGGAFTLDDMYGQYTMDNGWNIQAGQKKLPFMHEELVADTGQQGAERSAINEQYSLNRAQGFFVNYDAEEFRFMGAFSDGTVTQNTEINNTAGVSPNQADYAFTGRGEFKWAGDWNRFDQFSSWNGNENAGMAGLAAHYQNGGSTVGTADASGYGVTADVSFAGSGWNIYGSAVYRSAQPSVGDDVSDVGLLGQGGWFVNDDWELFGRITWTIPDDNDADGNAGNGIQERDQFSTFSAGANWFITPQSEAAKFTVELMYVPEGTIAANGAANFGGFGANNVNNARANVLTDAEGGQWGVRAQLQLMF